MLFSLLKPPYENEANAVFICNTNLMNSGGLMILPYLIKAIVSLAESLLPSMGLVLQKRCRPLAPEPSLWPEVWDGMGLRALPPHPLLFIES